MHFTILYVDVKQTLGVVTARVRYVPNGSFMPYRVRLTLYAPIVISVKFLLIISMHSQSERS